MIYDLLRKKIFHLPLGIWVELLYLVLVFLFCLYLKKSISIIVPLGASFYAFVYILMRRFKGYLAAYAVNAVVIFIISIILNPIRVYDSVGRFSSGNEIIAFLFLFFAVISTLALQSNRKWFDEIHSHV